MKVFTKKGLYLENLGWWLMLATFGYKPAQSMALTSFKLSAKELAIVSNRLELEMENRVLLG